MKVKLEPIGIGPYIKAPPHCPYLNLDMYYNGVPVISVNSSLCPLCKLCEFIPDTEIEESLELKTKEFVNYLTLINNDVSRAIAGQIYYLQQAGRIPISIFISIITFESMLRLVYRDNENQYKKARLYFLEEEKPICYISGCPVYLSRKLSESPVNVFGEVKWKNN